MTLIESGTVVLGAYVCEERIGVGGMAEVWRARNELLGIPVALKVLTTANRKLLVRFKREARLLAQIKHPNVVSLLDYGDLPNGAACIVMELVPGQTLRACIDDTGPVPVRQAVAWISGVLDGLAAMHDCGVLHRDIKPANLVVVPGMNQVVKIIDFGIACPTFGGHDDAIDDATTVAGTPRYMAPEQVAAGKLDARVDVYAVGIVLRELLGEMAFNTAPPAIRACLEAMVAQDPANRPSDARVAKRQLVAATSDGHKLGKSFTISEDTGPVATATPLSLPATVVLPKSLPRRQPSTPTPLPQLSATELFAGDDWLAEPEDDPTSVQNAQQAVIVDLTVSD